MLLNLTEWDIAMPLTLLDEIQHETRKLDATKLLTLMQQWTDYKAYRCGSMIGFGEYHYQYDSGHEGDAFVTGFAPRKQNLAIYIMPGFSDYTGLLSRLGKHKLGKSCLYVNKLADIDLTVLEALVRDSVVQMQNKYVCVDKVT